MKCALKMRLFVKEEIKMKKETIEITCYGSKEIWHDREKAKEFYLLGMNECEGSEKERYAAIYCQLCNGQIICSDEEM